VIIQLPDGARHLLQSRNAGNSFVSKLAAGVDAGLVLL
jgi:hypothetical protein